jgi:hypothetical protein
LAFAAPAQAPATPAARAFPPASQGFTPRPVAEASPAAQALATKKPSGFLQLFRRIAGAANGTGNAAGDRKASGGLPSGSEALSGRESPAGRVLAEGRIPSGRAARPGRETARGSEDHPAPQTLSARSRKKAGTREAEELASEARTARQVRRGGEARKGGRQAPEAALAAALPGPAPAQRPRGTSPREAEVQAVQARREPRPAQARVFVLDLRSAEGENPGEPRRASAAPERAETSSFERALLARESGASGAGARSPGSVSGSALPGSALQERLLPEIVHQAGIILRDGGEGEIRLVLKPEHLGSVRIRLHLGESSLEGRIVVDNSNVKELLEAHLWELKSALRQEGYATANIDVTVSGDGGRRRELEPDPALPAVADRSAGGFERAIPASLELDLGFTAVNLLA